MLSVAEIAELVFDVAAMLIIIGYSRYGKKTEENPNLDLYVISADGTSSRDGRIECTAQVHETPNYSESKLESKPA